MFVNNHKASQTEKIIVFSLVVTVFLLAGYVVSLSKIILLPMPGWIAICGMIISIASLQTAFLLYYESKIENNAGLCALAAGYLIVSILSFGRIITFPGIIFQPDSWEGYNQITFWFWLVWHVAFPLFIILYSLRKTGQLSFSYSVAQGIFKISPYITFFIMWVFYNNIQEFPLVVQENNYVLARGLDLVALIITVGAFFTLMSWDGNLERRDLWLLLVVFAHFLDLFYKIMGEERYTIGWYLAMVNSVIASTIVLVFLLYSIIKTAKKTSLENDKLSNLVETDALSGLASRRKFDSISQMLWNLALKQKVSLCLMIIDIDHFKEFNDKFGHPAGDECLRSISAAIKEVPKRDMDIVARIGGEEFAILMYGIGEQEGLDFAEQVRGGVENLKIPSHVDGQIVTVSVGYSTFVPQAMSSWPILLEVADEALYKAKNKGRNQVYYMDSNIKNSSQKNYKE